MDKTKFERVCQDSKLRPVRREQYKGCDIFVADGWFDSHPEHIEPHYKTLWAIGKGEDNLLVAQPIYYAGSVGSSNREDRVSHAFEVGRAAVDVIDDR